MLNVESTSLNMLNDVEHYIKFFLFGAKANICWAIVAAFYPSFVAQQMLNCDSLA